MVLIRNKFQVIRPDILGVFIGFVIKESTPKRVFIATKAQRHKVLVY